MTERRVFQPACRSHISTTTAAEATRVAPPDRILHAIAHRDGVGVLSILQKLLQQCTGKQVGNTVKSLGKQCKCIGFTSQPKRNQRTDLTHRDLVLLIQIKRSGRIDGTSQRSRKILTNQEN
jgi:hypothetical protein